MRESHSWFENSRNDSVDLTRGEDDRRRYYEEALGEVRALWTGRIAEWPLLRLPIRRLRVSSQPGSA